MILNGETLDLAQIAGKQILLNAHATPGNEHQWCKENSGFVDQHLYEHGALLIRGLTLRGSKKLEVVLAELFQAAPMEYNYRSTPRTQMRGNIYTSSEYHAQETIVQHNEAAYSNAWPMRIGFCCVTAPESGGQTPITDSHLVYTKIEPTIIEEFNRKGLMYVRNYCDVDLHWHEVFQTKSKSAVEAYCKANRVECEWLSDGNLRTRQVNQASIEHPVSRKMLWFNQAHLFHISALDGTNQKDLLDTFGEDRLPRNVYFADGSPIEDQKLNHVREIYQRQQISFDWQDNDLLLLDNMLFTHGRNPFTGNRKVLVGMARPYSSNLPDCP